MKFQDKFYDIIGHKKCPSSEKSAEKCIWRKSNLHGILPIHRERLGIDNRNKTFPHELSDLHSILQVTPCMTCLFAAEDYNDPASSTSPPPPACAPMLAVLSVTDLLQSDLFILCTLFTMYLQCIYNVCH